MARYTLEGSFLGLQRLTDDLSSCPMDMDEVDAMTTFGVVTEYKCEFNLWDITQNDLETLPQQANVFFELFIEDAN